MGMNFNDRRFGGRQPNRRERRAVRTAQRIQPRTDQGKGAKSDPNIRKGKKGKKPINPPKVGWGGNLGNYGPGGWGGGKGPGTTPPGTVPPGATPGAPDEEREGPPGWIWDEEEGWVEDPDYDPADPEREERKRKRENDLFAEYRRTLEEFGLEGFDDFLKEAVREDWSESTFMLRLRREKAYLANPLFAANMERASKGGGFMAEGQLIAYANETKRLAKQYGYGAPSDNYIAQNISSGRSLAEFEHRVQTYRNVENYGPAVRMVMEDRLGIVMGDDDLYEMFDKEIDTEEWTRAYKDAVTRGRPFALGLGIRSQEEADALRLLGVDPDEAFSRYSQMAQNAPRVERLGAIEQLAVGNLPDNFGDFMATVNNGLQFRAFVGQDPAALAEIQSLYAREIGRMNRGGGAASSQGVALGLLSGAERATFG